MKIKVHRGYSFAKITDEDLADWNVYTPAMSTLDLCGQGRSEGDSQGLIPVKLPGGLVVTPRVTVTSALSTNRRGTRSAVVKVSIPYTAVSTNDEGTQVTGTDPKRSVGEISFHIVVALPANAARDLTGGNGVLHSQSASAQVAVVGYLLNLLVKDILPDNGLAFTASAADPESGVTLSQTGKGMRLRSDEVRVSSETATAAQYRALMAETANVPVVSETIAPYSGQPVIDASQCTMPTSLSSILVRIVNGLAPLGCDAPDSAALPNGVAPLS